MIKMRKVHIATVAILMVSVMYQAATVPSISSEKGNLCYSPESYDFGYMAPGEKASTEFEVWACCGCQGGLYFDIIENCSWIDVSPTSGYSVGERITITVTVDTTGLSDGLYEYSLRISSNSGVGFFDVRVNVSKDAAVPPIEIEKPKEGWVYINDNEKFKTGLTVAIGKLTVEVNVSGNESTIEKVNFYLNNKHVSTLTAPPYTWVWSKPGFMLYRLKVEACNKFNKTSSAQMMVLKIL